MRILVIAPEYPPEVGGIGAYAFELDKGLKSNGVETLMLASSPGPNAPGLTRLPGWMNRRGLKLAGFLLSSAWLVLRFRPDAVLAMSWPQAGLAAWGLRLIGGPPYAVAAHGYELLRYKKGLMRHLMRLVLGRAGLLVANSSYTAGLLTLMGADTARVLVINPPVDQAAWPKEPDTRATVRRLNLTGKRVLLTTSRLEPRKGQAQVIRALNALKEEFPDLVYVMTGEGEFSAELEDLAAGLGVADRLRFAGFVSAGELARLYRLAEIYVSPSLAQGSQVEGFGISFIEAGLYELPVIAGATGGTRDAVEHGKTGFLLDPEDVGELTAALRLLLTNPGLAERTGRYASKRSGSRFTPQAAGRRLSQALKGMTSR